MNDYRKEASTFDALREIVKNNQCVIITATQMYRPNKFVLDKKQYLGPIFIDYIDGIK